MKRSFMAAIGILAGFVLAFVASVPLHELGHMLAAGAFGIPGYIEVDWASLGGTFQNTADFTSGSQVVAVDVAGGLFVAALYGLLLLALEKLHNFRYMAPGLTLVAFAQFGYGIGEGIGYETSVFMLFAGMALGIALAALELRRNTLAYMV